MKFNYSYTGPWDQGGRAPLELRFYRVKIFKMGKISFFLLFGPPLRKNRSQGPAYRQKKNLRFYRNNSFFFNFSAISNCSFAF